MSAAEPADRFARAAIFGYATRSRRSAVIMRMIDLLNPTAKDGGPCELKGHCIISSVAGVGDLFIHLPLIEGIIAKVRDNGGEATVALRPAHAEIGRAIGWKVIYFENPLQDIFGGTINWRVLRTVLKDFREMRCRKPDLWIDLTGNAFNAFHLRMLGIRNLAARVTRGGRSLVRHRLPNERFENEYENRKRLAEHLGCCLDTSVFKRLALRLTQGYVLLGVSTNCLWRNWPIARFLELARRFPKRYFVLAGLTREIDPESAADLAELLRLPNVENRMDQFTLMQLVEAVSGAAAVVTNDTSIAHIANALGVPGAVLFGPGISEQWALDGGLRIFHDRSCPLYPCVAWRCGRPEEWCMEKIAVDPVAEHLRAILTVPSHLGMESI